MSKKPAKKLKRLTEQQKLFAREYVRSRDMNATQAAARAGYSQKSAARMASFLLANPLVMAEIERLQAERIKRLDVDADFVLDRLVEEVQADMGDLLDVDGTIKPVDQWPMLWRQGLVAGFKVNELWGTDATGARIQIGVRKEIRFSDRLKRLELIGRHVAVQAFNDRLPPSQDDPLRRLYNQIAGNVIRPRDPDDPDGPIVIEIEDTKH